MIMMDNSANRYSTKGQAARLTDVTNQLPEIPTSCMFGNKLVVDTYNLILWLVAALGRD
jgi:hypothetical protein